jgi:hypothetical protein
MNQLLSDLANKYERQKFINYFETGKKKDFFDTLFRCVTFANLEIQNQLEILHLFKTYKARYTEDIYYEALWYPQEIQEFVKEFLPRDLCEDVVM